ncbi:hypothetical protein JCM24511_03697 [Saitozyma sp. JCM 24511]|nr:hypothetical protein JCM24511_03697 [Saitozyma sp. JCM 24511]
MSTPYSEAKPEVWAVHSHDPSGVSDQHSRVEKQPAVHEEAPLSVPELGIEISHDERALHRRVNMKMDLFVLPIMSLLYLMNGIDRSNVGNAATVNFTQDVGMPANAVNNAVSLFFITFIIFQPISSAIGKAVGVKYWMPFLMVSWGLFTLAHAYVKSEGELIAFRLMVGVFEAGFYPCSVYYLSTCYIRYDLAFRVAIFYGCYAIAGAFSGLIAYGLLQVKGALYPWQYLFIVEGAFTCALGVFALFWLPRHISTAWFLKEDEREWAAERMARDSGGQDNVSVGITMRDVKESLKDWKFWVILPANIAASVPGQAFSVFLPIIVKNLGYASYRANLFSVPPYAIGAVGLWCFAYSSDHFKERAFHIITALGVVILGLILVNELPTNQGKYAALCILQIGSYTAPPLTVAWLSQNTPSPGKRALIMGFNGWGNLAGVIGSQLFRAQYAPAYRLPFFVCLGVNIFAFLAYLAYRYLLLFANRRRAAKVARMSPEEVQEELTDEKRLGDKKYTFRYTT